MAITIQAPPGRPTTRKDRGLRRILVMPWGYGLSAIGLAIARSLEFTSIGYDTIVVWWAVAMVAIGIHYLSVRRLPEVTKNLSRSMGYVGLAYWYPLFFWVVVCVDQIRNITLLAAVIALMFLLTFGDFISTFTSFIMAAAIYLAGAYGASMIYGETISWGIEIFWALSFVVVGFVFAILAESLNRQRSEISRTKKAELRHAQDLIVQSEKLAALGQLVASIGHEIANPAMATTVSAGLLQKQVDELEDYINNLLPEDDDTPGVAQVRVDVQKLFRLLRQGLETSVHAAQKLEELSRALRTQSRMEAEVTEGIDINEVVRESLVLVSGRAKRHTIDQNLLEIQPVTCIRSRIGQVITNLIANAADALNEKVKARAEGTAFQGHIAITTKEVARDGDPGVSIVVADNGEGVPENIRKKIFEEFFTTKPAGAGTGLGLSMCATIVQDHGGLLEIRDDNELGGAQFEVWIPLHPSNLTAESSQPAE